MADYQHSHRRPAPAPILSRKHGGGGGTTSSGAVGGKSGGYDEVFGGPVRYSGGPFVPTRPEDYAEIFGGVRSSCSIPVLDLPPPADGGGVGLGGYYDFLCGGAGALDYLDIFGGFDGGDFAVSYEELFFANNHRQQQEQRKWGGGVPEDAGGDNRSQHQPSSSSSSSSSSKRGPKETSLKQAMEISGLTTEVHRGDHVAIPEKDRLSSNGDNHHLACGMKQFSTSCSIASHKEDAIDRTLHMSLSHAVPGFTSAVDAPLRDARVDNPPIHAGKVLTSNAVSTEETAEQKHSCGFTKSSGDNLKADQKESNLRFTASNHLPENEQYHSCPNNESKPDGVSAQSVAQNSFHADSVCVITEGRPTHTFSTKSSSNDLQVDMKHTTARSSAIEDIPTNDQQHLSHSSSYHSTASGSRSFLDCSSNDFSFNADFNAGIAEAKSSKKTLPTFPSHSSLRSAENDMKEEQKPFISASNALRDAPVKGYQHSLSSNNYSMPNGDQSCPEGIFLSVSDINLRTQPSRVPPPARPPPKLVSKQEDQKTGEAILKSYLCGKKSWADFQMHDTGNASKSHIHKLRRDSSPHFFDVEVDASSAAAADAAMKEAMEQAEARLKSAKVSMERNKVIRLSRKKLASDGVKYKERKDCRTDPEDQRIKDESYQAACKKMDAKGNGFSAEGPKKTFETVNLTPNLEEKGRHSESIEDTLEMSRGAEFRSRNVLCSDEKRAGEWKVEEQFFDLFKSEKLNKVQENSEQEGNKNNLKATTNVKEQTSESEAAKPDPELKRYGKSVAASVFEDNSNKLKKTILASQKDEIKETSKAIPEAYPQEKNDNRLKASLHTCQQEENEKKLREDQESQGTEQECKWTTLESSFIFEVGEMNLKTDIGIHKCDGEQKKLKIHGEDHQCIEGDKKVNGIDKTCEDEGERNHKVTNMMFELDEIKKECEVPQVVRVFERGMILEGSHKILEDQGPNKTVGAVAETCQHEEDGMILKEARTALGQAALHTFEWTDKEDKLRVDQEALHSNENEKKLDAFQVAQECTTSEKKMEQEKESNKLSGETQEELQRNEGEQNRAEVTCELKDFDSKPMAVEGDCEQSDNENVPELMHDLKDTVESTQGICHGIENEKETKYTQQPILFEEKVCRPKTAPKSMEAQDTKWTAKSIPEVHKTEEKVNEERIEIGGEQEKEQVRKLEEKEKERTLDEEKEREERSEEEEERERERLEEERMKERERQREGRRLEEQRESERRRLEVEKERERKRLEEERENERRLEVENERQRRLEEEKERERRKLEEEKGSERKRLEEEKDSEGRRLEEEKERRRLEEEKERDSKKLEEENEREKRRLVEGKDAERKISDEKERERKILDDKERERKLEEEREREREREKDRQAVERATLEARERAFAEARERAERAAVERITAEARQRALAEAREKIEKASAEALEKSLAEKSLREARLRVERAAVERATAEARERAVEKALAEKAAQEARERSERSTGTSRDRQRKDNEMDGNTRTKFKDDNGIKRSTSSSDTPDSDHQFQNTISTKNNFQRSDSSNNGSEGESAIRCKARLERHQRTVERAAKALAEKNTRDLLAQREQAERNRLAETLDADVRRWSNGKEGNLRALLSTLQYILGPESGWQPMSLTDVLTASAVKKAYRKATLCVHPDKLQQRGASIQHKYICEKVFDLLKEAWNRFNSEER